MTQERALALRPMGILEIVDQTFRLYRANFWLFFGIAAIVYVPLGLLQTSSPTLVITAGILSLPAGLIATGALTKAVSDRYMGDTATVGSSYGYVARRFVPFVLTIVVAYIFVASGILLLVVGMIVFAFWVTFVTEIFVIEDKRYLAAIWRGKFLVGQGVWAEVIGLGIITGIITMLIQLPTALIAEALGEPGSSMWLLAGIIQGLGQSLAWPISLVASILLYYDSRIRKEGFDLEVLARELGRQAPYAPGGADWPRPAPPPRT